MLYSVAHKEQEGWAVWLYLGRAVCCRVPPQCAAQGRCPLRRLGPGLCMSESSCNALLHTLLSTWTKMTNKTSLHPLKRQRILYFSKLMTWHDIIQVIFLIFWGSNSCPTETTGFFSCHWKIVPINLITMQFNFKGPWYAGKA